jgi:hypothetical protein
MRSGAREFLITGPNFYVDGSYKMLKLSSLFFVLPSPIWKPKIKTYKLFSNTFNP